MFALKLSQKKWSLTVKLTLSITVSIVVAVFIITLLSISRERQIFQAELLNQAKSMLDTLSVTSADPLYNLDIDQLAGIAQLMNETQAVVSTRFYDAQGRIIADPAAPELVRRFKVDPFGRRLVASDNPLFEWQPDQLLAGQSVRIGPERLGAVSVTLSTTPLTAQMTSVGAQGLGTALLAIFIGTLAALLLSRSITGPVRELVRATQFITTGDLTQKISLNSRDELEELGAAMEQMRSELQQLYQELERQVAQRTTELTRTNERLLQEIVEREQVQEALMESEERLRHVFSSISDHIYVTEITKDRQYLNRYLSPTEALTGYPVERFIADWNFWPSSLIYPDDRARATAQTERLLQGYNSEVEYRLIQADGQIIWVRDSGRVEKDPASGQVIVYGVVSNITERKQAEAAQVEARDKALEASRLKTELLAKVSHELRTPLGAILGFTEMLQLGVYGPISSEQQQVAADIIDSAHYLTGIVNELLDQAQIETGKINLNIRFFAPADLIKDCLAKMSVLAQVKGLSLTADIAADVPTMLSGDPDRLQQILVNLVSNAIKFTQTGAVQIRLYCPDSASWVIEVSDTGPGIPLEAQGYIFEPFRQVNGSNTRAHSGTGLGLSIVKQFVTLMGGQVTLASEVGWGSVFTIRLPLILKQEEVR